MSEHLPRTSWVFGRPLLRDGLFWGGLALGVPVEPTESTDLTSG